MSKTDFNPDLRTVFFIGAGMSAESGVPTYRGAGGIWSEYRHQDHACQRAFDRDADLVLEFHEMRRAAVLACAPHAGHEHLARLQALAPNNISVVTQNIDGLLQRAGIVVAAELHGSLWRVRCPVHGAWVDDAASDYASSRCPHCPVETAHYVRPDITWFEDSVNPSPFNTASALIDQADVFVAIGCSAVVMPAAGLIQCTHRSGTRLIEINTEATTVSDLFHEILRMPASRALKERFFL